MRDARGDGFTVVVTADGTTQQAKYRFAERAVIGRGAECDIRLLDPHVSRRHAALAVHDGCVTVADLRSRNGTDVAGRRLYGTDASIPPGGTVRIVSTLLQVHLGDDESAETAPVRRAAVRRVRIHGRGQPVEIDGCSLDLAISPREYRLIDTLHQAAPASLHFRDLGDAIWGPGEWDRHMLHNIVSIVRRKLRAASGIDDPLVITLPRHGYRLA